MVSNYWTDIWKFGFIQYQMEFPIFGDVGNQRKCPALDRPYFPVAFRRILAFYKVDAVLPGMRVFDFRGIKIV